MNITSTSRAERKVPRLRKIVRYANDLRSARDDRVWGLEMTEFEGDLSKPQKVACCRKLVKPPRRVIFF
jgi:hypothetical protein